MKKQDVLYDLAQIVGQLLNKKNKRCCVAESCTGGALAATMTAVPGSSQWFDRGFVTYSNEAKQTMLGVAKDLIDREGAVSEAVAKAMAKGAFDASQADLAIAITGIAGPTGGSAQKPVGTVWIAWTTPYSTEAQHYLFTGDRQAIREQSIKIALEGLIERCHAFGACLK